MNPVLYAMRPTTFLGLDFHLASMSVDSSKESSVLSLPGDMVTRAVVEEDAA